MTQIKHETSEKREWPKVAIIVLNWNGWRDTIECLESLQRITYPNYQVILVDNGSTDDSVERIKAWARGESPVESKFFKYDPGTKPVQWIEYDQETAKTGEMSEEEPKLEQLPPNRRLVLIQTGRNLGFTGGNNVAIKRSLIDDYDCVLLLNNDTIVEENFLTNMAEHAEKHENIGIIGCKIYFAHDRHRISQTGGSSRLALKIDSKSPGAGEIDRGQCDTPREVTFIIGATMLVKKQVFKDIGLLDERFFCGRDDFDFCRRATKAGYRLLYVPDGVVWHKVGRSRYKDRVSVRVYQKYKTDIIYMKKHLPGPAWLPWFFLCAIYGLTISSLRAQRNSGIDRREHRQAVLLALREGFRDDRVTRADIESAREHLAIVSQEIGTS